MLGSTDGAAAERTGRLRILFVGEIGRMLDLDRTLLRRNEIRLLTASATDETLNIAQREPLSLIVIEVGEQPGPCLELCRNLKGLPVTEDIPVVLLAPSALGDTVERCGADAVLYKPLPPREFVDAIARLARLRERQHRRYPVNLRFAFSAPGTAGQAFSRVVSYGGAFLKTDVSIPRGTRLKLSFRLPGDDSEIRCSGTVRSTSGWIDANDLTPGFGVEFNEMTSRDRTRLSLFLHDLERRLGAT